MPFFSIIIASYNAANTILKTLNSLKNQSFLDFEIVIVDDGSTDETKLLIDSIDFEKINYVHQENGGVTRARNFGASKAKGKYIVFLDSDDYVSSDWLRDFHDCISESKSEIVFCDIEVIDNKRNSRIIKRAKFPYDTNKESDVGLFLTGSFCVSNKIFIESGMYDEHLKFGENTELGFRINKLICTRSYTNKIGLYYEVSTCGGSKNLVNRIDGILYTIQKHKSLFLSQKTVLSIYYQNIGESYRKLGKYKSAIFYFLKAWLIVPYKFKNILRMFFTIFQYIKSLSLRL